MRGWTTVTDEELVADYERWLESTMTPNDLIAQTEKVFRDSGPAMRPSLRLDLSEFLRERTPAELAGLIALNDDPREDRGYMASLDAEARRPDREPPCR